MSTSLSTARNYVVARAVVDGAVLTVEYNGRTYLLNIDDGISAFHPATLTDSHSQQEMRVEFKRVLGEMKRGAAQWFVGVVPIPAKFVEGFSAFEWRAVFHHDGVIEVQRKAWVSHKWVSHPAATAALAEHGVLMQHLIAERAVITGEVSDVLKDGML